MKRRLIALGLLLSFSLYSCASWVQPVKPVERTSSERQKAPYGIIPQAFEVLKTGDLEKSEKYGQREHEDPRNRGKRNLGTWWF